MTVITAVSPIITEPGVRHRHHMRHRLGSLVRNPAVSASVNAPSPDAQPPAQTHPHPGLMPGAVRRPLRRSTPVISRSSWVSPPNAIDTPNSTTGTPTSEQRPNGMPGADMPQPIQQ